VPDFLYGMEWMALFDTPVFKWLSSLTSRDNNWVFVRGPSEYVMVPIFGAWTGIRTTELDFYDTIGQRKTSIIYYHDALGPKWEIRNYNTTWMKVQYATLRDLIQANDEQTCYWMQWSASLLKNSK
jgi:hypothetical protein